MITINIYVYQQAIIVYNYDNNAIASAFFIYKKSISHANVACMVISSCAAPEG